MTSTLWIHRDCCTDLLVRFPSAFDAYKFGCRFLKEFYEGDCCIHSWDESSYIEKTTFYIGDSPSLQVSIHPGEFHSDGFNGLDKWAPDGTFIVSPEEAMTLGNTGIPSEESAPLVWTKESAFAEGTNRYRLLPSDLVNAVYDDFDFSDVD
jgi:hypothetical protein